MHENENQYGKKIVFGFAILLAVAFATLWRRHSREVEIPSDSIPKHEAAVAPYHAPKHLPSELGPEFDIAGIKFPSVPALTPSGLSLELDVPGILEAVEVPQPPPQLSKKDKVRLRQAVGSLCSFVRSLPYPETGKPEDETFSTNAPVWKALTTNCPSILTVQTAKPLVVDDRVSIFALFDAIVLSTD